MTSALDTNRISALEGTDGFRRAQGKPAGAVVQQEHMKEHGMPQR